MNLSVAIGMNQDAVLCAVCTSMRFINDVVVMPTCYMRNGLVADWADASLFLPEVHQPTFSLQGFCHLYAEACFKIEFPDRIVGVTFSFDLYVPGYWCCGGEAQQVSDGFSVLVFRCPEEAPVPVAGPSEVLILHPLFAFGRVSPPCPSPQGFKDGRVDMGKGFLGRCMLVKVCPSSYLGIEGGNQPVCCGLFVTLNDLSDVSKERFDVLFRRAGKEFPVVLAYMLSEKVESILNGRYLGFLFREFQASFAQKLGDEGFDFRFQYLLRDACNNEVVTVPHQVDLFVIPPCGVPSSVG